MEMDSAGSLMSRSLHNLKKKPKLVEKYRVNFEPLHTNVLAHESWVLISLIINKKDPRSFKFFVKLPLQSEKKPLSSVGNFLNLCSVHTTAESDSGVSMT